MDMIITITVVIPIIDSRCQTKEVSIDRLDSLKASDKKKKKKKKKKIIMTIINI